jgi:hypothetical protein
VIPIVVEEVPGLLEALHAVQYVGGVLLHPDAAKQLVVAAWLAAEPATRAAAFADAADILHERGDTAGAHLLDMISHEMRSPR